MSSIKGTRFFHLLFAYFCIARNMRRGGGSKIGSFAGPLQKISAYRLLNVCRASRCDYDVDAVSGGVNSRRQKAKVNGAEALCNAPIIQRLSRLLSQHNYYSRSKSVNFVVYRSLTETAEDRWRQFVCFAFKL